MTFPSYFTSINKLIFADITLSSIKSTLNHEALNTDSIDVAALGKTSQNEFLNSLV